MSYIISTTKNTTNFSANFTNVLFCNGTGYHLAHNPRNWSRRHHKFK